MTQFLPGDGHPHWRGDEAGVGAIHQWLNRNFSKKGQCEECGATKATDYAFLRHPLPYTRNREDYKELCRGCHWKLDGRRGGLPEQRALIKEAKRWKKQYHAMPKINDWRPRSPRGVGYPSYITVIRRFGSWNIFIAACGWTPRPVGRPKK